MTNTEAMASDETTQVEPHRRANCVIAFVSSSMNPAPSRKHCQDHRPVVRRMPGSTSVADAARINQRATA
jgi:hypothetical protein